MTQARRPREPGLQARWCREHKVAVSIGWGRTLAANDGTQEKSRKVRVDMLSSACRHMGTWQDLPALNASYAFQHSQGSACRASPVGQKTGSGGMRRRRRAFCAIRASPLHTGLPLNTYLRRPSRTYAPQPASRPRWGAPVGCARRWCPHCHVPDLRPRPPQRGHPRLGADPPVAPLGTAPCRFLAVCLGWPRAPGSPWRARV